MARQAEIKTVTDEKISYSQEVNIRFKTRVYICHSATKLSDAWYNNISLHRKLGGRFTEVTGCVVTFTSRSP